MATLEGTRELARKLDELGRGVQGRVLRATVKEAMLPTYRRALSTVPIGTRPHKTYKGRTVEPGFTQENLRLKTWVSKDKGSAVAMVGVNEEAYYALQFVELGSSKQPAKPWLTPAFEASQSEAEQIIGREMRRRIENIAKRRAAAAAKA